MTMSQYTQRIRDHMDSMYVYCGSGRLLNAGQIYMTSVYNRKLESYFLPSRSILLKSSCPFGPEEAAAEPVAGEAVAALSSSFASPSVAFAFRGMDAAVKLAFFLAPIPALRGRGWNMAPGTLFAADSTARSRVPSVEFRLMSVSSANVMDVSR